MLRSPVPGHRRYSITHRAVQRLRELVPTVGEEDDEALRDRLDAAITTAEDGGKAVRTLDVMLAEPQILIPLESFGETLYAIIKEDTVVTVLPRGHGEEILQRGQALEQRVAAGEPPLRPTDRDDAWELSRRRWRRDAPTPVVERVRSLGERGDDALSAAEEPAAPTPVTRVAPAEPPPADDADKTAGPARLRTRRILAGAGGTLAPGVVPSGAERKKPSNPVAEALARGLITHHVSRAVNLMNLQRARVISLSPLCSLWPIQNKKRPRPSETNRCWDESV